MGKSTAKINSPANDEMFDQSLANIEDNNESIEFSDSSSTSFSSSDRVQYNEEFGNINPEEFDLLAEFTDDEEFETRQKNSEPSNKKRKLSEVESKDKLDENINIADYDNGEEEEEEEQHLSDEVNEEEDFRDAMREANNFKPRKNKKSKDKTKKKKKTNAGGYKKLAAKINPELSALIAKANVAYVSMDLKLAEELFSEIIKKDSNQFSAYKTLGDIYQQQNRLNDCCNIWMLGAHLNPSDFAFWKDVAMLSLNLNHISQALYCFNKVLQLNSSDDESLFERSKLCSITGQVSKAIDGFNKLFIKYPFDQSIITEYVTLLNKTGKQDKAVAIYKDVFKQNVAKRQFLTKFREQALASEDDNDDEDEEGDGDEENDIELEGEFAGVPVRKAEKYQCMPFDWSALNIMIDLILDMPVSKTNDPKKNILMIKDVARFIQFRESQTFWNILNNNSNDVEFDDRREFAEGFQNLTAEEQTQRDYALPIDIRVRLGILRLKNRQIDEAKLHFHFLLEEEVPQDFYDLYFVAGKNLTDNDQYEEAILYLEPLLKDPAFKNDVVFYKKIGKCYKILEKYDSAVFCFEKILELQPEQLDNKLNLAEIYHYVDRIDEYKALLEDVINERKQIENKNATRTRAKIQKGYKKEESAFNSNKNSPDIASETQSSSFTPNSFQDNSKTNNPLMETTIKVKKHPTPTQPITKQEREERIKANVIEKFSKLTLYKQDSMVLWQDTVSDLLNIFTSVRNLFLKRRSGQFEGVISRSRRFDKLLDYKIEKISLLDNDKNNNSALPMIKEEKVELVDENGVRGLDYDTWFKIFMEFVFVIAKERGAAEGLELLDTAEDINVFYGNETRSRYMKFVRFAIEDDSNKWELVKHLINSYQFNRKIYSVVLLVLQDGSKKSFDNICHKNLQKLVLRTIKTFDSFRFNKKIVGSAALINNNLVPNKQALPTPYLYYLFGICFFSSKTYGACLQYFLKIDLILQEDPMLKYMIGISYLNKAMQRQTTLRNFYMLHAFKYLNQYRYLQIQRFGEKSQECLESEYNVGKVYQMLGLNTLAMKHYWRILSTDIDSFFKKHAAFNLVNLYINGNSFENADLITKKYLQVE